TDQRGVTRPAGSTTACDIGAYEYQGHAVTDVTVHLADSTGAPLAGGTASYYAHGWHTIGTTGTDGDATVQTPRGSYSFAVVYHGTREQLNKQAVAGAASTV